MREGRGKFEYADTGDEYEGDFKHNQKQGYGIYRYSNGDIYEGEFVDNKPEGRGKL